MAGIDLLRALLSNRVFAAAPGWNDDQWGFAEFACSPAECAELFQQGLIAAVPVTISDEVLAAHGRDRERCGPITHEWRLTEAGRARALQAVRRDA
ncbi:hypothetical protein X566_05740 [Afipia sp. P52-10]|jgi:hypothetical protein|uniref:hypothetical protein n=1 Tax=Afipia sp. P52-10 TaxID=1429916 RepID=UPI0003DF3762|nr:hypothetical protein [Afipia sp. P52-10]ETR78994.1 hypothetical protein X566_05740 [Afipia sp. P52-10]